MAMLLASSLTFGTSRAFQRSTAVATKGATVSDRYANFAATGAGRALVKRLGLPDPPRLRRYHPGARELAGAVLLGGDGRLAEPIARVLANLDADVRRPTVTAPGAAETAPPAMAAPDAGRARRWKRHPDRRHRPHRAGRHGRPDRAGHDRAATPSRPCPAASARSSSTPPASRRRASCRICTRSSSRTPDRSSRVAGSSCSARHRTRRPRRTRRSRSGPWKGSPGRSARSSVAARRRSSSTSHRAPNRGSSRRCGSCSPASRRTSPAR